MAYADSDREVKTASRHKLRNLQYVYNYLGTHPCVDCGETDVVVLEFDHVRGVKRSNVMALTGGANASIERIQEEIDKCDVRCANDHRRATYARLPRSHRLSIVPGQPVMDEPLPYKGEEHHWSKFTDEQKAQAVAAYKHQSTYRSYASIASDFGMSGTYLQNLVKGRRRTIKATLAS